jgi:hypothetical protein
MYAYTVRVKMVVYSKSGTAATGLRVRPPTGVDLEIRERIAEIAHRGNGFQKHLGEHDGGTDVQVNASCIQGSD